ncbi:hypothetical protein ACE1TH_15210 [Shouchella sp. JSM 1781072]|uniref:tubby C-terminal domain-like protein n=1 Tax=Bacillaceae TaxID=186817 RepID=UPI0020D0DA79|nr:hypothetical protein [Alkalihalobacillus sp. LMS6]UTR05951.1 hypothetical protein MM326_18025 [Alkalihalobacillus sp. LMS6]
MLTTILVSVFATVYLLIQSGLYMFADQPFSDQSVWIAVLLAVALTFMIIRLSYTFTTRKRTNERFEQEEQNGSVQKADVQDEASEWHYQEPIYLLNDMPIRIFDENENHRATLRVTFTNRFERISSIIGLFDYRNIYIEDEATGDSIYFKKYKVRESFIRPKWNVYMNEEKVGLLALPKITKEQIKNQAVYEYTSDRTNETFKVQHRYMDLSTRIFNEGGEQELFHAKRSFFGWKSRKRSIPGNEASSE